MNKGRVDRVSDRNDKPLSIPSPQAGLGLRRAAPLHVGLGRCRGLPVSWALQRCRRVRPAVHAERPAAVGDVADRSCLLHW
jgi:hypothetical protein